MKQAQVRVWPEEGPMGQLEKSGGGCIWTLGIGHATLAVENEVHSFYLTRNEVSVV